MKSLILMAFLFPTGILLGQTLGEKQETYALIVGISDYQDPNFRDVLQPPGYTFLYLKQFDKAEKCFSKLFELRPKSAWYHYNFACFYSLKGEIDRAFLSLEKAIELGLRDKIIY